MKDKDIHIACKIGDLKKIKLILSYNLGELESKGSCGHTPIMKAVLNGQTAVVKYLLSRGALIPTDEGKNAEGHEDHSALAVAESKGYWEIANLLSRHAQRSAHKKRKKEEKQPYIRHSESFEPGDVVRVFVPDKNRLCPGMIIKKIEGYKVFYEEDNEIEDVTDISRIKNYGTTQENHRVCHQDDSYSILDRVRVYWDEDDVKGWYDATVLGRNSDGTFKVLYDGEDSLEKSVDASNLVKIHALSDEDSDADSVYGLEMEFKRKKSHQRRQIEKLQREVSNVTQNLARKDLQYHTLKNELQNTKQQLSIGKNELTNLMSRFEMANKKQMICEEERNAARVELEDTNKQLSIAKNELADTKSLLEKAHKNKSIYEHERNMIRDELVSSKSELSAKSRMIHQLESEISSEISKKRKLESKVAEFERKYKSGDTLLQTLLEILDDKSIVANADQAMLEKIEENMENSLRSVRHSIKLQLEIRLEKMERAQKQINQLELRLEKMEQSQNQMNQVKEEALCTICVTHKKCVILLPCKHNCFCKGCSDSYKKKDCPLCRSKISEKMIIYL